VRLVDVATLITVLVQENENSKNSLEGVTLVAMRNGEPVENQAEAVTALLRPAIAAALKHAGANLATPAPAVLKTTKDRNRRISDLEIECARLMHGLRLADRRYEMQSRPSARQDWPTASWVICPQNPLPIEYGENRTTSNCDALSKK
jgi:hypothetical protein